MWFLYLVLKSSFASPMYVLKVSLLQDRSSVTRTFALSEGI